MIAKAGLVAGGPDDYLAAVIRNRAIRRGLSVDLERLRYANGCLFDRVPESALRHALYVGVGHGHDALLAVLNNQVDSVVGVDPYIDTDGNDTQDYDDIKATIQELGLEDRFSVVRERIEDYLQHVNTTFDCIVFNDVLHHIFVTDALLRNNSCLPPAVALFESLGALTNAGGTLVISDVERHGLRPFLIRVGALTGHVNYRTKQPREEWTHAAVKGGWSLFDQANYVPWRFRAMEKFWSGAPGRFTLCDKYFLYFSRTSTHSDET